MALSWTRLSCRKFVTNQVRPWLFALDHNWIKFMRMLAEIIVRISRLELAPGHLALRTPVSRAVIGSGRVNGPPQWRRVGRHMGSGNYAWWEDGYPKRVGHFSESDAS